MCYSYFELSKINVARQQIVDLTSAVQEMKKVQGFTHLRTPLLHLWVYSHVTTCKQLQNYHILLIL